MSFLQSVTESGISFASDKYSDVKTVILSNYLSLVLFVGVLFLLIIRLLVFSILPDEQVIAAAILFLFPLLSNYFGHLNFTRLYLCWMPMFVLMGIYIIRLKLFPQVLTAEYDSLKIFQLGFSCFPYLLLSPANKKLFIVGLLVPLIIIIGTDSFLNFLQVGHDFKGTPGDGYELNKMRTFVAYFILNGSCFSLKWLVEKGDEHNEMLLAELAEKNQIIERQVKEQLQEASSRLALATRSAGIGIWEWDLGTDMVSWDEQMHLLFEIPYEEGKARDWRNYLHPDDSEDLFLKLNSTINAGKELNSEFRVVQANGEVKHLYAFGMAYWNHDQPSHMVGVCWDITKRKLSEEQLLQSEANLYATINNTTFFIWSIDRNYQIVNVNKPFKNYIREQFGLEVKEGQLISELGPPIREFSTAWIRNYKRALTGESFEIAEEHLNRHFKY
ncbi:MAG: PAS domain-containing protein, partial [Bacteroidota bacterium]